MSSAIVGKGFEHACHQDRMDLQHLRGNVLGWQQLKRQHSPPRDSRPPKKRYGSENISPEALKAKGGVVKVVQEIAKTCKKSTANKPHPNNIVRELNVERRQDQETQQLVPGNVENDFDMDDIIPIQLNLGKVPVKYCDDRLYINHEKSSDLHKAETQSEDTSRQADDNFKEKIKKPLNELMNLFNIGTKEESLQYMLVGMKLQLLGMSMTKPGVNS